VAAVGFHQALGDGESEPGAPRHLAFPLDPVEGLK
jgi:hypothetical protein